MKVVIAADSYKNCMTSKEVADTMEKAIHTLDASIEVQKFVVGDGGEGTMRAFVDACNGMFVEVKCRDAYGKWIYGRYGVIDKGCTAVIEVSNVIGLGMYPREERNALYASSYGVGQLLAHALKRGCKKMILALGGSATNDGGMGLLEALGVRFYDVNDKVLKGMAANLQKIARIDDSQMLDFSNVECIAACDVKNKLLGAEGATYVFGKQKGLFPNQMRRVEKGMTSYASLLEAKGYVIKDQIGGGSAGGIGAIFMGVLHARMESGIQLLFSYNHIAEAIKECDLVLTGEGQSDKQTLYGKVPVGVIDVANQYHKPCVCISGALGLEYKALYEKGFIGIYSVADRAMSFAQALEHAKEKLEACTYSVMKTVMYFRQGE